MSKVVIKDVKRKTTISKAAIKKAAKIAYANVRVNEESPSLQINSSSRSKKVA